MTYNNLTSNENKLILAIGEGETLTRPYRNAGYDCRRIELPTTAERTVAELASRAYGIVAMPALQASKRPGRLRSAEEQIADACKLSQCLDVVEQGSKSGNLIFWTVLDACHILRRNLAPKTVILLDWRVGDDSDRVIDAYGFFNDTEQSEARHRLDESVRTEAVRIEASVAMPEIPCGSSRCDDHADALSRYADAFFAANK